MTVNGVRKKAHHMRFNMIFNERVAVVHHFSPRYFAGATLEQTKLRSSVTCTMNSRSEVVDFTGGGSSNDST